MQSGNMIGGMVFQPQQQQQQQLQQQGQQMGMFGGQLQLLPTPGAPGVRPMVSRRQQQQPQIYAAAAAPPQQQQQQYQAYAPQFQQQQQYPQQAYGAVGGMPQQQQQQQQQNMGTIGQPGPQALPMQAWQLLPPHICESLVQILAARPNLGPAFSNLQGLGQLSGLAGAAQARVVEQLWSIPVPPVPSMVVGLLQILCSTAGP
jgi:hypothetical protein